MYLSVYVWWVVIGRVLHGRRERPIPPPPFNPTKNTNEQVTDDALGHLADSCPRLRRLALWGCTQVGWFVFVCRIDQDRRSSVRERLPMRRSVDPSPPINHPNTPNKLQRPPPPSKNHTNTQFKTPINKTPTKTPIGDGPLSPGPPPAGVAGRGGPRGVGQPRLPAQGPGVGVGDGGGGLRVD